jgi:hypothetical protein
VVAQGVGAPGIGIPGAMMAPQRSAQGMPGAGVGVPGQMNQRLGGGIGRPGQLPGAGSGTARPGRSLNMGGPRDAAQLRGMARAGTGMRSGAAVSQQITAQSTNVMGVGNVGRRGR